jgi:hypothetical protein
MAGRYVRTEVGVCFIPRFAFLEGTTYVIEVDGVVVASLPRHGEDRRPVTAVTGIWPSAGEVPRNLLRLYVRFSAPMSEGYAAKHVSLLGEDGRPLDDAFFLLDQELWDGERRRLTVWLDPARIKRGLIPHRGLGYPLVEGESVRLVVDRGFRDAGGRTLGAAGGRTYRVGADERRRVEPATWTLRLPPGGTVEPLNVSFGRPLDHGLLARCLHVEAPDGRRLAGWVRIGPGERSWSFHPEHAWSAGRNRLIVDPILEDVSGNSVRRVFDRDLGRAEDDPGGVTTALDLHVT